MVTKQKTNDSEIKADTCTGNNTNDLVFSRDVNPIGEAQSGIRKAYRANVESQKALLSAFKEQEQWAENAYKSTERRYRAYEEIIDKAFKNRETMDNAALELYRTTVEKAGAVYRETIKHSLLLCKQTTDQAWRASIRAHEPVRSSPLNRLRHRVHSSMDFLSLGAKNIKTKLIMKYKRIRIRLVAKIW